MRPHRVAVIVAMVLGSVACCATGPDTGSATGVGEWVRVRTGECADPVPGTIEQFAEFVGPLRAKLYAPYVAEWATCEVKPYEKLGLVVFHRDRMAEFEKSWRAALDGGEVRDDPDFAFGDGFALSATTGLERLGLDYLRCKQVPDRCVRQPMTGGHHH